MIRHDDKRMQFVSSEPALPILQRPHDDFGNFAAPEIQRPARSAIQQPVHGDERLTRSSNRLGRENALCRKTAVQPERDKQRLIDSVPMREPPFVTVHRLRCARLSKNFSL